ncbi:MAG: UDP-glucuronic acid decarboxylase family protein [Myxococcota bacterium]
MSKVNKLRRVLVTGGAGFIGSHLCRRLLAEDCEVIAFDNLLTGRMDNIEALLGEKPFSFEHYDVTNFLYVAGELDAILHFASPASPADFERLPIQILKVGALGTHRALGLAKAKGARFLLASTSECYGDPEVNPQPESYWGNVNPVGVRGVYDEAKRFAEAMTMAYHRHHGVDVRVMRIFNTFGPRMQIDDGRAIPNFFRQAVKGSDVTVYGDGSQTRSICYVDDLVEGAWRLLNSDYVGPMNIGSQAEVSMLDLAQQIIGLCGSSSQVVFRPLPPDDPKVRRADTSLAQRELGWSPQVPVEEGLRRTRDYFVEALAREAQGGT